jgi:hypothetical protein
VESRRATYLAFDRLLIRVTDQIIIQVYVNCDGQPTLHETVDTVILISVTGITIIDLSDPSNPAYCFVNICGLREARRRHIPRNVPLSARQYFEAYSPPGKEASSSCVDASKTRNGRYASSAGSMKRSERRIRARGTRS